MSLLCSLLNSCHPGYHGERCHGLSLPVENRLYTYDHTTILAVVAVVLSSVCLLVIVGLLMFRCVLGAPGGSA